MSVKLEKKTNGRLIIISETVAWWIRLIGLPFLCFGLYMLSMIFYSIYYYVVEQASFSEWLWSLPGMLITLLFALIFLAPGAFFVFGRLGQQVRCDLNTRQLVSTESILPWKKGVISSLDDYEYVQVEYVSRKSRQRHSSTGSTSTRTNYYFEINLYGPDEKKLYITTFQDSEQEKAVDFTRKIGQLFSVEVKDDPWDENKD